MDLAAYVPNPLLRARLAAEIDRLRAERDAARRVVNSLAERVYLQSELLSRKAEARRG